MPASTVPATPGCCTRRCCAPTGRTACDDHAHRRRGPCTRAAAPTPWPPPGGPPTSSPPTTPRRPQLPPARPTAAPRHRAARRTPRCRGRVRPPRPWTRSPPPPPTSGWSTARTGRLVLEGAQGVLLDEWHGFHPYTTWSTTTFAGAERLLAEAGRPHSALRLGVVRTCTTRHGPGPLVTEDPAPLRAQPEPHNGHGRWQGAFRAGHFDAVAHSYAVEVCGGVAALAVTHLDAPGRCGGALRTVHAYRTAGGLQGRLRTAPPGDLARQQRFTASLLGARPADQRSPGTDPRACATRSHRRWAPRSPWSPTDHRRRQDRPAPHPTGKSK
ncbi:adenylosuccinate synthetase [Streptomyces lydicus]|uniref:adenylosuccinate synthetase n=1 Tax=Streptomyces lydicus TaxID=47763 RepID=UPI0037A22C3A